MQASTPSRTEPRERRTRRELASVVAIAALTATPLVVLIVMVARYAVDVPFWDEWHLVILLRWMKEGTLGFRGLWWQHNEHRILFPRIIMLTLARVTDWDIRYECAANVVLAALTFLVLLVLVSRTRRSLGLTGPNWLLPVLSAMVFSLSQWESWLWGWQIAVFLNVLAVAGGVTLLSSPALSWRRLLSAIALGVVATYSFACGLLYWWAVLPLLLARPGEGRGRVWLRIGGWCAVAAAVYTNYFQLYIRSDQQPSLMAAVHAPLAFLRYTLNYLGHPVSEAHAGYVGAAGVAMLMLLSVALLRLRIMTWLALLPYLCLSLYAGLSAAMTGVGRLGFGASQSLSSRYITFANLLWIPLLVLLSLTAARCRRALSHSSGGRSPERPRGPRQPDRKLRRLGALCFATLLAAAAGSLITSVGAVPWFRTTYNQRAADRAKLAAGARPEELQTLYPVPFVLRESIPTLQKYHLSVFRKRR